MEIELIAPIAMEKGLRFAIREGGRTVGPARCRKWWNKNTAIPIADCRLETTKAVSGRPKIEAVDANWKLAIGKSEIRRCHAE